MSNRENQSQSQNITTGDITIKRGSAKISQSITSQHPTNGITDKKSFVEELGQVIVFLERYREYEDVAEAIKELELAKSETQSEKPDASMIRRFINSARGIINGVTETLSDVSSIASTIAALAKLVPTIFS